MKFIQKIFLIIISIIIVSGFGFLNWFPSNEAVNSKNYFLPQISLNEKENNYFAQKIIKKSPDNKRQKSPNIAQSCRPEKSRILGPLQPFDESLLKLVFEEHLIPPSNKPYNLIKDKPILPWLYYIENVQSWPVVKEVLTKFFIEEERKTDGFFVEVGAYDGEFASNSMLLEKELGWSGLLIEADQVLFKTLLTKHRKAWSSNSCLSLHNYPYMARFNTFKNVNVKLTNSLVKAAISDPDNIPEGHVDRMDVQCLPLQTVIKALNVTHVDLISLDVEGSEMKVLENFSWNDITVDVWVTEHLNPSAHSSVKDDKEDPNFLEWFREKGYVHYKTIDHHSPFDYVFVRRNSVFFEKNAKRLGLA